jgi:hypothetical protein
VSENATEEAIERYRRTLFEMADDVGALGHTSSDRRWKRLTEQLDKDQRVLAESPAGRSAIKGLIDDPRPTVRLFSATATLGWDEPTARPVLVELREDPLKYGLHSILAKHTLLDHDGLEHDDDDAEG